MGRLFGVGMSEWSLRCGLALIAFFGLSLVCLLVEAPSAKERPRAGPDRPATVDWTVVVTPLSDIRASAIFPNNKVAVAVGEQGTILHSEDSGKTWQDAETPLGKAVDLKAVAVTGDYGIAVGTRGTILRTTDGGKTWRHASVREPLTDELTWVMLSGSYGLALSKNLILRTEDSGETWIRAVMPAPNEKERASFSFVGQTYSAMAFVGDRSVVVNSAGSVLWSADNGETWTRAKTPSVRYYGGIQSINLSDRYGVAVGQSGSVLWSSNFGETWSWATIPSWIRAEFRTIAIHGDNGFIVGTDCTILWTANGGETWNPAKMPDEQPSYCLAAALSGMRGVAVGPNGTLLRSPDRGRTWERVKAPIEFRNRSNSIAFNEATGIVVGRYGAVFWTEDGGEHWAVGSTPTGWRAELGKLSLSGSNAIVVGERGTILHTEDAGRRWTAASRPSDAIADLHAVELDGIRGIAAGASRTLLWTEDGGKTWKRGTAPNGIDEAITAIALSGERGVALGDQATMLWTDDAGKQWKSAAAPQTTSRQFTAVALSGKNAVAIGNGPILWSEDAGQRWNVANGASDLHGQNALTLIGNHGIVANERSILWTEDGGKRWSPASIQTASEYMFVSLLSLSGMNALAAGSGSGGPFIMYSSDAGKTWLPSRTPFLTPSQSPSRRFDFIVALALDGESGVALLGNHERLSTRDAGRTWTLQSDHPNLEGLRLRTVALSGPAGPGVIIGDNGALLRSASSKHAPYIVNRDKSVEQALDGRISVDLTITDDEGDPVINVPIEYSVDQGSAAGTWTTVPGTAVKSDGHWRLDWSPSDRRISDGSTILHRVRLDDGGPPLATIVLNPIVYNSFWTKHASALWSVAVTMGGLVLYLLPTLLFFWAAPARLALSGSGTLETVADVGEASSGWAKLAGKVIRQFAMPWFKRQPRVRKAWVQAYEEKKTDFKDLDVEVRKKFLDEDDVMDTWVARRITTARKALDQLQLYDARRIYIPFPVRIAGGIAETVNEPGPKSFARIFANDRVVVPIIGGGGSGKSTLACALARWTLANDLEVRLQPHLAIPVFISEDTEDLMATILTNLGKMIGVEGELDLDIVRALLKRKRIVIIIDALSERSISMQKHVEKILGSDAPLNALIVTTRREPSWGALENTQIFPQPISLRQLVPFIIGYLQRRQLTTEFEPDDQLALAQRILKMARITETFTVTPLLVTLFVDSVVSHRAAAHDVDQLPVDVPSVYLDYLRRLNPANPGESEAADNDIMLRSAMILGKVSLRNKFLPTDFRRDDAEAALTEAGLTPPGPLVDKLVSNGVVHERDIVPTVTILRFHLDPIAEYLAAIAACRELGEDIAAWMEVFHQLTETEGYPGSVLGYLTALSVCYSSYKNPLKLPKLAFPWEALAKE